MKLKVKICGINTEDAMEAAVAGGAAFVGLVFYPPSPRCVSSELAAELTEYLPDDVIKVGLFVDPDDDTLSRVLSHVRLDMLQLHGKETPERVDAVRLEYGLPVMKAVGIATPADLIAAESYYAAADWLLFDAKAPPGAARPGGNAQAFDWSLLKDHKWPLPWMLAGGLTADNLAEAVRATKARAVDISSSVESAPGVKDPLKIRAFLEAAGRL